MIKGYDMLAEKLYVTMDCLHEIEENLKNSKKIAAIKALRTHTGCTLKEAKWAVDRHVGNQDEGPIICPRYDVVGVKLQTPDGIVEVDLEGLQLVALQSLPTLGLSTCRDILGLVDLLKKWKEEIKSYPQEEEDTSS